MASSKTDLRLAALFCALVGLYDLVFVVGVVTGTVAIGYRVDVPFSDFLVFHAAARAFLEGNLSAIYDTAAFTHLQNVYYGARLPYELGFRPFLYPPLWLLDLLPFGPLPFTLALVAFLGLTATACAVVLRAIGLGWRAMLAIFVAPAASWVVLVGQNTFLSVALLYGGLALLERRPLLAGVLLGLLAYKPQVWLLVPLALLAARAWRPVIAMGATVLLLALITLLLFGAGFWRDFLAAAAHASTGTAAMEMYQRVHTHMTTLLAAAKIVGFSDSSAMALQLAGAVLAVGAVIWVFARHRAGPERTAILVTGTFLVSPYTLNYDLLLLMPAAALLFLNPAAKGHLPGERAIYLLLWLIPGFCMGLNAASVPVTPLIVLAFAAVAWARLQVAARDELPDAAASR
jgi:alpha-1,2-mannosyltransferase